MGKSRPVVKWSKARHAKTSMALAIEPACYSNISQIRFSVPSFTALPCFMFVSSLISSKVAPVAHSGSHFASGAHTAVWQLLPQLLPPLLLVKTKPWTPSAATSWSFHFCCWWNAATSTFVSLPPSLQVLQILQQLLLLPLLPPQLLVKRCHLDYCLHFNFATRQDCHRCHL